MKTISLIMSGFNVIFQNIISSCCITAQMTFERFFSCMGPNVPLNFTGILECLRTIWTYPLLWPQSYWQELKSTRNSVKIMKHTDCLTQQKDQTKKMAEHRWQQRIIETKECSCYKGSTLTHLFKEWNVYFSHACPDELFEWICNYKVHIQMVFLQYALVCAFWYH